MSTPPPPHNYGHGHGHEGPYGASTPAGPPPPPARPHPAHQVGGTELLGRGWKVVVRNLGAVFGYGLAVVLLWGLLMGMVASVVYADLFEEFVSLDGRVALEMVQTEEMPAEVVDLLYEASLRALPLGFFATVLGALFAAGICAFFLQRGRGGYADFGTVFHGFRAFATLAIGGVILHLLFFFPGGVVQVMALADGGANLQHDGLAGMSFLLHIWSFVGMALFLPWALATLDQGYRGSDSLRRWWHLSAGFRGALLVAYLLYLLIMFLAVVVGALVVPLLAVLFFSVSPALGIVAAVVGAFVIFIPIFALPFAIGAAAYDAMVRYHREAGTGMVHAGAYPDPAAAYEHAQYDYGHGYDYGYGHGYGHGYGYGDSSQVGSGDPGAYPQVPPQAPQSMWPPHSEPPAQRPPRDPGESDGTQDPRSG